MDEFFIEAFGGLISVIASNIKITVKTLKTNKITDVRICQTFGANWKKDEMNSQYIINLNQLSSGISKDFVCEISIPPVKSELSDIEK